MTTKNTTEHNHETTNHVVPPAPKLGSPATPSNAVLARLTEIAKACSRTKLPRGVPNWESALRLMLTGWELGLPPMASLNEISLGSDGKTALNTRCKVSLVRMHGIGSITLTHSDASRAECTVRRNEWPDGETRTVEYTEHEAEQAGLLKTDPNGRVIKDNWRHHKREMLVARLLARATNWYFQEIHFHTPDELGLDTDEFGDAVTPDLGPDEAAPPPWAPQPTTETAETYQIAASKAGAGAASETQTEAETTDATPSAPSAIAAPLDAASGAELQRLGQLLTALQISKDRYVEWLRFLTGKPSARDATALQVGEMINRLSRTQDIIQVLKGAGVAEPTAVLDKASKKRGIDDHLYLTMDQLAEILDAANKKAAAPPLPQSPPSN